jgi:glycosyltransferase involved in cell wall biosynthesis
MSKSKILIALSRFPYPTIDGTRYKILHNVCDGLEPSFDIEFFIVTFNKISQDHIDYLEKEYGKVHLFRISFVQFLLQSVRSLVCDIPFQTAGFYNCSAQKFIRNHIHDYDAVYVHTIRMAEYFRKLPHTDYQKILIEFNDAISLNYTEAKKRAAFPMNVVYATEEHRVIRYEQTLLKTFDHFNVISPYDKEYLVKSLPENIKRRINFTCIPHGIADNQIIKKEYHASDKVYFIGQLDYVPNRDSIYFFLDIIWPVLKKDIPNSECVIIGKGDMKKYDRYVNSPGVTFTGFVSDAYAIIKDCACLVAPIRFGAGMPSKIIEAMAYGIPVVTTPVGVRGIAGLVYGENSFIIGEHDIKKWIEIIKILMNSPDRAQQLGLSAQVLIHEQYTCSQVQKRWENICKEIIEKNKKTP